MLEITHTEFANASPEAVWGYWSRPETWSEWDLGVEWCKLEEGHTFEKGAKVTLMPKGAPEAVSIEITECETNRCFSDEGKTGLGLIRLTHSLKVVEDGIEITHTLQMIPSNEKTQAIFEQTLYPKLQKDLPESVKMLAQLAEKEYIKV